MLSNLRQIQHEANNYLLKLSSVQQADDKFTILEVKRNKSKYAEAIVLLHVNESMSIALLSQLVGMEFTTSRLDIVTDFFLRDILFSKTKSRGKSWTGSEILSTRQMSRRRSAEMLSTSDEILYTA